MGAQSQNLGRKGAISIRWAHCRSIKKAGVVLRYQFGIMRVHTKRESRVCSITKPIARTIPQRCTASWFDKKKWKKMTSDWGRRTHKKYWRNKIAVMYFPYLTFTKISLLLLEFYYMSFIMKIHIILLISTFKAQFNLKCYCQYLHRSFC